ncbi:hypothetical protein Q4520_16415 [Alteromonas sp. 1_MG-2023]|uniref:hypothetical protein n=1 Tax=Alteromonas sp. 1_MG-2023 TaxID=3062669 RepID=UPI0026E1272D|nr:hypothetical protein [Alteromonas sp. 1_MG-2023]MDO6477009.1 hypothetical protein [Alteromonas sp. 1_MG-2023]
MKSYKAIIVLLLAVTSSTTFAQQVASPSSSDSAQQGESQTSTAAQAEELATTKAENELDQFGFGPALYMIKYENEVLKDSKDVTLRGDGSISSNGSDYSVTLGFELHYDFSFGHTLKCYTNCSDSKNWNVTSSHRISPFLGVFDVDNGINGIALGVIYGYTKGDGNGENKATLNFGVGKIIHKDRLVLAHDVKEGISPSTDLNVEDYTERKDVDGITFMISANIGF